MVAAAGLCALLLGAAEQPLSSIVHAPFDFSSYLEDRLGLIYLENIESILHSQSDLSSRLRDSLSRKAVEPPLFDVRVMPKLTLLLNTLPTLWKVVEFEYSSKISEFNQANTPGSWEYFDHNRPPRPPNWEYFQNRRRFVTCKTYFKLIAGRVLGAGQESQIIRVRLQERRLRRRRKPRSLVASEPLPPRDAVHFWTPRGCVVIRSHFLSLFLSLSFVSPSPLLPLLILA